MNSGFINTNMQLAEPTHYDQNEQLIYNQQLLPNMQQPYFHPPLQQNVPMMDAHPGPTTHLMNQSVVNPDVMMSESIQNEWQVVNNKKRLDVQKIAKNIKGKHPTGSIA